MVNTTTKYIVFNHDGSGIRHHHFTTANDIIAEANGVASAGDTLLAQGFQFQVWKGTPVPFAFMTVSGGKDGPQLYTTFGNHDVHVDANDIVITVVYAPPGGTTGPGGCAGVWVDAFNVDTGSFSDQPHIMQVLTNGVVDNAITDLANSDASICTDI